MFPLPRGGKWLPVLAGLFISGLTLALVLAVTGIAEPTREWSAKVELVNITIPSTTPVTVAKSAGETLPVKPPEHLAATPWTPELRHPPVQTQLEAKTLQGLRVNLGWLTTIASWYAYTPPTTCWDPSGKATPVPRTLMWTANKELPCGTWVEVSGPAGTVQIQVWDRGPYLPGRSLDLSTTAFQAVAGSVSQGLSQLYYRVAG